MGPNPQFPPDVVTFTEEILNGKLQFLCSVTYYDDCLKLKDKFNQRSLTIAHGIIRFSGISEHYCLRIFFFLDEMNKK